MVPLELPDTEVHNIILSLRAFGQAKPSSFNCRQTLSMSWVPFFTQTSSHLQATSWCPWCLREPSIGPLARCGATKQCRSALAACVWQSQQWPQGSGHNGMHEHHRNAARSSCFSRICWLPVAILLLWWAPDWPMSLCPCPFAWCRWTSLSFLPGPMSSDYLFSVCHNTETKWPSDLDVCHGKSPHRLHTGSISSHHPAELPFTFSPHKQLKPFASEQQPTPPLFAQVQSTNVFCLAPLWPPGKTEPMLADAKKRRSCPNLLQRLGGDCAAKRTCGRHGQNTSERILCEGLCEGEIAYRVHNEDKWQIWLATVPWPKIWSGPSLTARTGAAGKCSRFGSVARQAGCCRSADLEEHMPQCPGLVSLLWR